jgi:hypothetical protein
MSAGGSTVGVQLPLARGPVAATRSLIVDVGVRGATIVVIEGAAHVAGGSIRYYFATDDGCWLRSCVPRPRRGSSACVSSPR